MKFNLGKFISGRPRYRDGKKEFTAELFIDLSKANRIAGRAFHNSSGKATIGNGLIVVHATGIK